MQGPGSYAYQCTVVAPSPVPAPHLLFHDNHRIRRLLLGLPTRGYKPGHECQGQLCLLSAPEAVERLPVAARLAFPAEVVRLRLRDAVVAAVRVEVG